ncbi:MAG: OadG family protein [Paludibacteraceae bacterium]|nr:OadG family protein [Paludibacteraceae bacterium]
MKFILLERTASWGDMLIMTLLGLGVVFLVLVLLVFVMKGFGLMFGNDNKPAATRPAAPVPSAQPAAAKAAPATPGAGTKATATETEMAAIAMALHMFYNANVHDTESYRITNKQVGPSAWNAKIFGMSQLSK